MLVKLGREVHDDLGAVGRDCVKGRGDRARGVDHQQVAGHEKRREHAERRGDQAPVGPVGHEHRHVVTREATGLGGRGGLKLARHAELVGRRK